MAYCHCGRTLVLDPKTGLMVCSPAEGGCGRIPDECECTSGPPPRSRTPPPPIPPPLLFYRGVECRGMLKGIQASPNLSESEKMVVGTVMEVFNDLLIAVHPYKGYSSTQAGIFGPVRELKTAAEGKEDLSKFAEELKTEIAEKLREEIATLKKKS